MHYDVIFGAVLWLGAQISMGKMPHDSKTKRVYLFRSLSGSCKTHMYTQAQTNK